MIPGGLSNSSTDVSLLWRAGVPYRCCLYRGERSRRQHVAPAIAQPSFRPEGGTRPSKQECRGQRGGVAKIKRSGVLRTHWKLWSWRGYHVSAAKRDVFLLRRQRKRDKVCPFLYVAMGAGDSTLESKSVRQYVGAHYRSLWKTPCLG